MPVATSATRSAVRAVWLGRIGYDEALALQREAAARVAAGGGETLFLLEHAPVFTLGRNASRSDILFTPERCRELGIAIRDADRGGKVTYHGPGQLVGYPIFNLDPDRRDVKRYVTDLEEVLIRTLADFGIAAARSPLPERVTSVWVGNDKIAAIGVHISRWVTTHGIVPCGIADGGVTTMERASGRRPALIEVVPPLVANFGGVFGREIIAP
jgi:lipoyl(octanoyl) transferase